MSNKTYYLLFCILFVPLTMCISDPGQHLPSVTVDPTITRVDVTYFHETKRCQACINMEKWAYEVVVIDNKLYVDGGLLSFK